MLSGLSPLQDGYRFATDSQSDFFHWTFNKLTTAKSEMIEGNFSCYFHLEPYRDMNGAESCRSDKFFYKNAVRPAGIKTFGPVSGTSLSTQSSLSFSTPRPAAKTESTVPPTQETSLVPTDGSSLVTTDGQTTTRTETGSPGATTIIHEPSSGLSPGATAGIAVGGGMALLFIILSAIGIWLFRRRRGTAWEDPRTAGHGELDGSNEKSRKALPVEPQELWTYGADGERIPPSELGGTMKLAELPC